MTIKELYNKIIADNELKAAFLTAAKENKVAEFLKAQGCEVTAAEVAEFLKANQRTNGEVNDEELDAVAGGGCCEFEVVESVISAGVFCAAEALYSAISGEVGPSEKQEGLLCHW